MKLISYIGGIFGALISYEGYLYDDYYKFIGGIILIVVQGFINLFHD